MDTIKDVRDLIAEYSGVHYSALYTRGRLNKDKTLKRLFFLILHDLGVNNVTIGAMFQHNQQEVHGVISVAKELQVQDKEFEVLYRNLYRLVDIELIRPLIPPHRKQEVRISPNWKDEEKPL